MIFEQEQLDALCELNGFLGTAREVAEIVEGLGFEIRYKSPESSRIYLTGCCSPEDGSDLQVGKIVKTEECEAGWKVVV